MMQFLFRLYVKFIRPHTEDKLDKLFEKIHPTQSTLWDTYKHLPMPEFSKVIDGYKYTPDPFYGAVDYAFDNPNKFFDGLSYGQDCDNWSRIWWFYGIANGYTAHEIIVTTVNHVMKDAHVVCVLEKDDKYWMCDYKPYGAYDSVEQAVEGLPDHWTKYTDENLIWEYYYGIRS